MSRYEPADPARRRLSDDDVAGWVEAASQRTPPRKRDRETLRNYLKARSPWKWAALNRYLRWAEKEMERLGLNPEDVRWIL